MLRIIQRCFGRLRPAAPRETAPKTTVLLLRVPIRRSDSIHPQLSSRSLDSCNASPEPIAENQPSSALPQHGQAKPTAASEVPLRRQGVFSPQVLAKLRRAGLSSTGDLLAADPNRLVQRIGAPQHWASRIRRGQRAIRFSRRFSDMTPREALMLFAAHRRSRRRLAAESAGMLKRDLDRLLLSSRGQKLCASQQPPEISRVRLWIHEAQPQAPKSAG